MRSKLFSSLCSSWVSVLLCGSSLSLMASEESSLFYGAGDSLFDGATHLEGGVICGDGSSSRHQNCGCPCPSFYATYYDSEVNTDYADDAFIILHSMGASEMQVGCAISRINETTLQLKPGFYEVLVFIQLAETSDSGTAQLVLNGARIGPNPEGAIGGSTIPIAAIIQAPSYPCYSTLRVQVTEGPIEVNEATGVEIIVKQLAPACF